jgi:hypothetical protein
VASAFVVGVAGSLYVRSVGSINPDSFCLTLTSTAIAMLVVGGLTSVSGAVIGTIVVPVALQVLRTVESGVVIAGIEIPARSGLASVGLALVLLGVLLARPAGIMGGRELFDVPRAVPAARRRTRSRRTAPLPVMPPCRSAPGTREEHPTPGVGPPRESSGAAGAVRDALDREIRVAWPPGVGPSPCRRVSHPDGRRPIGLACFGTSSALDARSALRRRPVR